MYDSSIKGYLNEIRRGRITKMIAELDHHIPQPHHGAMSGKIQTGRTRLVSKTEKR